MQSLIRSLLITVLLSFPFPLSSASSGQIEWLKYDQALRKAKAENKHILVNFTTTWCGWCKKMKATTYQDQQVLELMQKSFVAAVVDGDAYDLIDLPDGKITEKGLTLQFGVRGYPTTWFLEPDGTRIAPAPGYIDATAMSYILNYVGSNLNESMEFHEYVSQQKRLETARADAKLMIGMSPGEVKASWGEPATVERNDLGEEWYYPEKRCLSFKNGKLSGFVEKEPTAKTSN